LLAVFLDRIRRSERAFKKLAAVKFAGGNLEGNDVALWVVSSQRNAVEPRGTYCGLVQQLDWYPDCGRHIGGEDVAWKGFASVSGVEQCAR
jgi:hypothetical protein